MTIRERLNSTSVWVKVLAVLLPFLAGVGVDRLTIEHRISELESLAKRVGQAADATETTRRAIIEMRAELEVLQDAVKRARIQLMSLEDAVLVDRMRETDPRRAGTRPAPGRR